MFNLDLSRASGLVLHFLGNKLKDEELILSKQESAIDEPTRRILWQYITSSFKSPDYYRFTHPVELSMNQVLGSCQKIFANPSALLEQSHVFGKLLFDASQHPQIKSGELIVLYFPRLVFADKDAPAIGIFKSERKQAFLFTEQGEAQIDLFSYQGIDPGKVDKAALIFNLEQEDGYEILSVDNTSKGEEARFWFDTFLKIERKATEFSRTSAVIDLTKSFADQDFGMAEQADSTRRIELLQNSKEYFKENDQFDYSDYAEQVLGDPETGARFKEFSQSSGRHELDVEETFDISQDAVKKMQRVFKSVLKLDKNFHVYVHGDRSKIEKGSEQGRKFYKLYYEEEN